jgi:hypothetical protein
MDRAAAATAEHHTISTKTTAANRRMGGHGTLALSMQQQRLYNIYFNDK